jgi:phage portal protein BeeE
MPDFAAVRRRLVRAEPAIKAASAWTGTAWSSGDGFAPWPALAGRDHAALVGRLADNPVVSIALRWIRQNIAQGRIVVGAEKGGDFEADDNHPLVMPAQRDGSRGLLRRPNPWDSWAATLGGTSDSLCVDGNAYWIKARDRAGDVLELYWAPNHQVDVVPTYTQDPMKADGPIAGYRFTYQGGYRDYAPSEVVHFRMGRDPLCRYMGLSDLKRQLRNATSIVAAERFTSAVLLNGHSGKVLSPKEMVGEVHPGTPDDAEMIRLSRSIERGVSGENAGRVTRTSLPVDLIDMGLGPNEMALREIVDRPEAYLLAALGLNALTLSLPGSVNITSYANKGEARREAWENAVIPLQDLVADEVEHQLLPDFADVKPRADSVWWDRKDVEALKENANDKATRVASIAPLGITTDNELRTMIDLPPIEGGDLTPQDKADEAMRRQQEMLTQQDAGQGDAEADSPTIPMPGRAAKAIDEGEDVPGAEQADEPEAPDHGG